MTALAVLGEPADYQRLLGWASAAGLEQDAIFAMAFGGRIDSAEHLLTLLDQDAFAAAAADSFGMITGLLIDGPFARANAPAGLDDMLDADAPVPEASVFDDLLVPDADNVRRWWRDNGSRLDAGVRHLYGQPWSATSVSSALRAAPTWRWQGLRLDSATAAAAPPLRSWARKQLR